jgi:hypothetical protein
MLDQLFHWPGFQDPLQDLLPIPAPICLHEPGFQFQNPGAFFQQIPLGFGHKQGQQPRPVALVQVDYPG